MCFCQQKSTGRSKGDSNLYAIVTEHPLFLSPTIVLLCECTDALSLSPFPLVYTLQQSHPSKPVDHEIRLRRKAVNDTGVDTNENIRMKKYGCRAADTVVRIIFHSFLLLFSPLYC